MLRTRWVIPVGTARRRNFPGTPVFLKRIGYFYVATPPGLLCCAPFPGSPAPLFADVPGGRSCPRGGYRPRLFTSQPRARSLPLCPYRSSRNSRQVPRLWRPCLSHGSIFWGRNAGCLRLLPLSSLCTDAISSSGAAATAGRQALARHYRPGSPTLSLPLRPPALTFLTPWPEGSGGLCPPSYKLRSSVRVLGILGQGCAASLSPWSSTSPLVLKEKEKAYE
jgi:hypothetical protein